MTITLTRINRLSPLNITYGTYESYNNNLGDIHIGTTSKGICFFAFSPLNKAVSDMKNLWNKSSFIKDNEKASLIIKKIFSNKNIGYNLLITGTEFQTRVWNQLLKIPYGSTCSYEEIAKQLGDTKLTRAVARAITKNNVAYLIPCHRVINKSGNINKYRWGTDIKIQLLQSERNETNIRRKNIPF